MGGTCVEWGFRGPWIDRSQLESFLDSPRSQFDAIATQSPQFLFHLDVSPGAARSRTEEVSFRTAPSDPGPVVFGTGQRSRGVAVSLTSSALATRASATARASRAPACPPTDRTRGGAATRPRPRPGVLVIHNRRTSAVHAIHLAALDTVPTIVASPFRRKSVHSRKREVLASHALLGPKRGVGERGS